MQILCSLSGSWKEARCTRYLINGIQNFPEQTSKKCTFLEFLTQTLGSIQINKPLKTEVAERQLIDEIKSTRTRGNRERYPSFREQSGSEA